MPRPRKQTVDYYPHDCKYGDTIPILEGMYGNDGYAFWHKLLEILGASEGHYLDCKKPQALRKLQARTNLSQEKCLDLLTLLAELEAIDLELWQQKIVWCQKFVDRLAPLYAKRSVGIPHRPNLINPQPKESINDKEYKKKTQCRSATNRAIAKGQLKKKPCEICGVTENIEAHHEDYNNPLNVIWLCIEHHRCLHNGKLDGINVALSGDKPTDVNVNGLMDSDKPQSKVKDSIVKESKDTPVGGDKSPNPHHNRFMGAWVAGSERYWGSEADKGLRGKAGAQFKRLFYPEFGSFARENPDRVCELIKRVWTPDEHQTTLERKCCKEGRTVGALTYLARSVLQKERASEQVEQDQKRTEARSKAEMRKLDEEVAAADCERDRLVGLRVTDPVEWAKSVLPDQDVTEEGLRKLLKSQFILGFHREAVKVLLEELTKQSALKEA